MLVPYGGAIQSNSGKLSLEFQLLSCAPKGHNGYWEN
jgi:hypothetical protein